MKGKSTNLFILILFFLLLKFLLQNSIEVSEVVFSSMDIFIHKLFPILFPFFVLSSLMSEYGVVDFLGELMKNITHRLFRLNQKIAFPLFFSMISGFPSGAKYTSMLYLEGALSKKEANQLLAFTHYANPAFILGTIGGAFLKNNKLALFIFLSHLIGGILTGVFITRKNKMKKEKEKVSMKKALLAMEKKRANQTKTLGQVLSSSINGAIENLFSILGTITFFMIIAKFMTSFLPISKYGIILLKGILEMTQGIEAISTISTSLFLKGLLITFFLSFGGISVHMQAVSMISKTNLSYFSYLKGRFVHLFLACTLFCFFFLFGF